MVILLRPNWHATNSTSDDAMRISNPEPDKDEEGMSRSLWQADSHNKRSTQALIAAVLDTVEGIFENATERQAQWVLERS